MAILSFVGSLFLGTLAVVACTRAGKIVIRFVNSLFDRVEDRIDYGREVKQEEK